MHNTVCRIFFGLLSLTSAQGSDGLWRSSLLDPTLFPGPETSGTAGFTYALAYGINAGLLDPALYGPVVATAWAGLSSVSVQARAMGLPVGARTGNRSMRSPVQPSGLLGWCQAADYEPRGASRASTADFCVGLVSESKAFTVPVVL